MIKQRFHRGDHVRLTPDAQEHYKELNPEIRTELVMRITHVAKNTKEHPGYDGATGDALYDLQTIVGKKDLPWSLYDYELTSA